VSVKGVEFTLVKQIDRKTGLVQVKGNGKGWGKEDKCWIDYLKGDLEFDARGSVTKGDISQFEYPYASRTQPKPELIPSG
jgi:hypothetical protein